MRSRGTQIADFCRTTERWMPIFGARITVGQADSAGPPRLATRATTLLWRDLRAPAQKSPAAATPAAIRFALSGRPGRSAVWAPAMTFPTALFR